MVKAWAHCRQILGLLAPTSPELFVVLLLAVLAAVSATWKVVLYFVLQMVMEAHFLLTA